MKKITLSDKNIKRIDKENMRELLLGFHEQMARALQIGKRAAIPERYKRRYKNIVFLGLGGSAIGADLIRCLLVDECPLPIQVVRGYAIPKFIDRNSLAFAVSYSGNTEESIYMYNEAKKRKAFIIAVTTGGKLGGMALEDRNPLIVIPKGLPPRSALGYSFIPPLIALGKLEVIGDKTKDILSAIALLKDMAKFDVGPSAKNNIAKKIAGALYGRIPVIYADSKHMDVAAVRWRGQIAENTKALASTHLYPEMNHNEIVGWQHPRDILKKFVAVTLRDRGDHPRVKTRMEISKSILHKAGFKAIEVGSKGDSLLSRIISLMYIGDFVSFYLSVMYDTDPTPVDRITYLKKQLAER